MFRCYIINAHYKLIAFKGGTLLYLCGRASFSNIATVGI